MELARAAGRRCGGEREGMMEGVCSDGAAVQRAGSQEIREGERANTMKPRDLPPSPPPPPSHPWLPMPTSTSRHTGLRRSSLVTNYCMEIEDQLFWPTNLEPLPRPTNLEQRQVWDKSYNGGRRKKWVAAPMDVRRSKKWVACAATFIVLLILFKPIYMWTLSILGGHTREDLCGMVILVWLTKRDLISLYQRVKCNFMVCLLLTRMVCLWVRSTVCLWVPRIERPDIMLITNLPQQLLHSMTYYVGYIFMEVAAIMHEISILLWEFCARYVLARSVNQAKTFEERIMPHRGQQLMPRIRGLWGMDIYKNKVHEFLERSDESFFGIWGRSGVGKTRLLSLISDCYGDSFSHLFALGGGSVRDMQYNLNIFLKLDWERMSLLEEHHRAKTIAEYLEHHSFLLLLDNVQDGLVDLAAIGLPMPLKRRQKVVLASRSQVVCGRMGCTMSNIVEMKCLGDEDAWNLFKYNLGVEFTDADTKIHEIAKQMVSECGGLPRAIRSIGVGVAGATCSGKDLDDWLYTYDRIKAKNLPPERMDEIVSVLV